MSRHKFVIPALILTAGTNLLSAQAVAEYGAAAGSSGAASAGAATGKSVVNIFGKTNRALAGAGVAGDRKPRPGTVPASSAPTGATDPGTAPKQAAPPELPPDLAALATGMERADMLKKVGKPSMSMSGVESHTLVETCWYKSGSDSVTVILRDGKVASISGLEKSAPK